jgi:hypothetical protein
MLVMVETLSDGLCINHLKWIYKSPSDDLKVGLCASYALVWNSLLALNILVISASAGS